MNQKEYIVEYIDADTKVVTSVIASSHRDACQALRDQGFSVLSTEELT